MRVILRPVVGVWALSVRRATEVLPRPEGSGQVYAPGLESDRILLLGSGPAVSWGVLQHELGLAGAVARELALLTDRGVDLFVRADADMTLPRAIELTDSLALERYDAVLVTVGVNDAVGLVSLRAWRRQVVALVLAMLDGLPADSRLFMTAVPSIRSLGVFRGALGAVVGGHARAMNAITAEVCAQHEGADFVELPLLPPEPHRYRSMKGYGVWGSGIAGAMAGRLQDAPRRRASSGLDEAAAATLLAAIAAGNGARMERLLQAVAGIAGTRFAAFSIAVDDHVWGVSLTGGSPSDTPYARSFTEATILSRDGITIPDARVDERFAGAPLVAGEPYLRFFAAYPIRSPEGSRIGALCVFDTDPDDGRFEAGHLRDFAQRLQQQLRELLPPQHPSGA